MVLGTARAQAQTDPGVWLYSTNSLGAQVGNSLLRGSHFSGGPTNVPYGTLVNSSVTSPFVDPVNPGKRYVTSGFTRTGSSPATSIGDVMANIQVTNNTTITWNWGVEYFLRVKQSEGGTVSVTPAGVADDEETGFWYTNGTLVRLTAIPETATFLQWGDDVFGNSTTNSIIMTGSRTVSASFGNADTDQDSDGLPDVWEADFGLLVDKNSSDEHKAWGDPDNDGLPNILEYRISYEIATNSVLVCSPINADSDGDGMDDGFEYNYMMRTGTEGTEGSGNTWAVVNPNGAYGPQANLDEDFHWNTTTGYRSQVGLTAIQEYIGSDTNKPGFWSPPLIGYAGITEPVFRFAVNPVDTGDQTFPNTTDSEIVGSEISGDGFDDGFEYTWDSWQGMHAGDPINDPLGRRVPYRWGSNPMPVSAALANFNHTVNNNRVLDLAVANYGHDSVSIMLGAGGGVFGAPLIAYSTGDGPRCVMAGDFLGDGTADDLVVANELSNDLGVLISNGDGTFIGTNNVPVGTAPSYLVVADFDGDGSDDVAVTCEGSDNVYILAGNDDGTFGVSQIVALAAGAGPVSLAVGNACGAGAGTDLAVANGGNDSWMILTNDATGTFTALAPVALPPSSSPSCIKFANLNGADASDIVLTTRNDDRVRSFYGNGDGTFTAPPAVNAIYDLSTGISYGPVHFALGYFNEEDRTGTVDLAIANVASEPPVASVLLHDDADIWTPGSAVDVESAAPVWVLVARLEEADGDMTDDLIIIQRDEPSVVVAYGHGDGTFRGTAYDPTFFANDRRFHPGQIHVEPKDMGRRDYDVQYDPDTGGAADWLSDELEYNAWLPPLNILRREFPDRPRCSHPFSWDADRDRMPDGWEMAFGYDPWDIDTDDDGTTDDLENPDGDWFAEFGALRHFQVYTNSGYHPGTGWGYLMPSRAGGPNTVEFPNFEELIGPRGWAAIMAHDPNDTATHPRNSDTDYDGMWDGWEWYVDLNAKSATDAATDIDLGEGQVSSIVGDGLSNLSEFQSFMTSSSDMDNRHLVEGGLNKLYPTDPNSRDTDNDGISDSIEVGVESYYNPSHHTYSIINAGEMTWEQAYIDAQDKGGQLATIVSSEEWQAIQAVLGNQLTAHWIGAYSTPEGTWKWGTDETWTFSRWAYQEPASTHRQRVLMGSKWDEYRWFAKADDYTNDSYILEQLTFNATYTDPTDPDCDDDGLNDGDEIIAGTSPRNARDIFSIGGAFSAAENSNAVILWASVSNRLYSVFTHTNLLTQWPPTPVYQVQGDGTQKAYTNTELGPFIYFRIGVELNP